MSNGGKKRVLIVDDEESIVEILTVRLEKEGFEVISAPTGERGFELAQTKAPDVVILDIFLPDENGLVVLKQLKQPNDPKTGAPSRLKAIPVIIMTGPGEKLEETFRSEGAFDFLIKPFELQTLVSRIRQALTEKSS